MIPFHLVPTSTLRVSWGMVHHITCNHIAMIPTSKPEHMINDTQKTWHTWGYKQFMNYIDIVQRCDAHSKLKLIMKHSPFYGTSLGESWKSGSSTAQHSHQKCRWQPSKTMSHPGDPAQKSNHRLANVVGHGMQNRAPAVLTGPNLWVGRHLHATRHERMKLTMAYGLGTGVVGYNIFQLVV